MKFPCLVSHADLLSIALASRVHVPLEGDAKGMLEVADKNYEKPDYSIGVYCQLESTQLLMEATQNSYAYFKPDISEFPSPRKIINVEDIDFTTIMSNDSVAKTNSINTIAEYVSNARKLFETIEVGDMVTVIPSVSTRRKDDVKGFKGELRYLSETFIIILDSNGIEKHFFTNWWSIKKTPIEPTPHDLLKQAWFEQGQDIDNFIDHIINEYGVIK